MKPEFADRYANLEQWHWWFRGRQRILEAVLQRELSVSGPRTIVSLGCGPAEGLRWLEPLAGPGGRVVGTDIDRRHARCLEPRIGYVVGDVERLPFASGSFDLVLALDALEHLDDDAAGLREAARLVRPGGLLLVTVPALPGLWGGQDVVSHHRRRYTRRSLLSVFQRAGLPTPRATYFNSLLLAPVAGVRWMRRALGRGERPRSDFEDSRPGVVNDFLATLFSAERHLVPWIDLPLGVSLLATVRIAP